MTPDTPPKYSGSACVRKVTRVTIPNPPPPPFNAQKRSGIEQALAILASPSAVTISASRTCAQRFCAHTRVSGDLGGTGAASGLTQAAEARSKHKPPGGKRLAGYATWRVHRAVGLDRKMLLQLTAPSLLAAFIGGLLSLDGRVYFVLSGLLLLAAACLMLFKRSADSVEAKPVRALDDAERRSPV
jgi:hypothetical protein